eukprot:CAMPEP_0113944298 /NCGR_PEP_ID=MMETSP1339-20121228/32930_1 /TAXON_ID=94617 /ORGANISM="Fibrocapsa japonica" /LENGTH=328 /DNA_ID=CAMNT_0000949457 /DNA_START=165 /DNA_END=1151 /DNA_ORIENTATION=+ /assembly_acc=CAM_ASM_000762
MQASSGSPDVAVLFDFDGTVGDTETPAMEIAYWELAPYFKSSTEDGVLPEKLPWMQENAGKPFEQMIEAVEEERKAAGLPSVAEVRANAGENPTAMEVVNGRRVDYFKLKSLQQLREEGALPADVVEQQKAETVEILSFLTQPCPGVMEVISALQDNHGIPVAVATTSPKPRVPLCIKTIGLDTIFTPDKVHSGESDFTPPEFKPSPAVYLKAAQAESCDPTNCVAVEDSASGVGSASNAGIGLIVGYVGASHIPEEKKESHAASLMAGKRATSGRGAEIVLQDMTDLPTVVLAYQGMKKSGSGATLSSVLSGLGESLKGRYWLNGVN